MSSRVFTAVTCVLLGFLYLWYILSFATKCVLQINIIVYIYLCFLQYFRTFLAAVCSGGRQRLNHTPDSLNASFCCLNCSALQCIRQCNVMYCSALQCSFQSFHWECFKYFWFSCLTLPTVWNYTCFEYLICLLKYL